MKLILPTGISTIDTALGTAPRPRFRQQWTLSWTTDDFAEQIVIDEAQSVLEARFLPYSLDIGSTALQNNNDDAPTVVVTLDQPLQIEHIRLTTPASGQLELYRMDGDEIAPEPTVSQPISNRQAEFLNQQFVAQKFAIRLIDDETPQAFNTGQIVRIRIKSYPTTPTVGLLDSGKVIPLWQTAGEIGKTSPGDHLSLNLSNPIQRYLDSLESLPTSVMLVAESDAPCQVHIEDATIEYYLRRTSFFSDPTVPKKTLKFEQPALTPETVAVDVPAHEQLRTTTVEITDSLKSVPASFPTDDSTHLHQRTGIHTSPDYWIAQPLTPDNAQRVHGLRLGLLALQPDTQLTVELQSDAQGQPSGEVLAKTSLVLPSVDHPRWYSLSLEPVVLQVQRYWCLLYGAKGSAVWLTTAESPGACLFSQTAQIFQTVAHFPQQKALLQLSRPTAHGEVSTPEDILFWINGQPIFPKRQANRLTVELSNLLSPSALSQTETLTIAAQVPGFLTVYPPKIDYEL